MTDFGSGSFGWCINHKASAFINAFTSVLVCFMLLITQYHKLGALCLFMAPVHYLWSASWDGFLVDIFSKHG